MTKISHLAYLAGHATLIGIRSSELALGPDRKLLGVVSICQAACKLPSNSNLQRSGKLAIRSNNLCWKDLHEIASLPWNRALDHNCIQLLINEKHLQGNYRLSVQCIQKLQRV